MSFLHLLSDARLVRLSNFLARFSGRWAVNLRSDIANTLWAREQLERRTAEAAESARWGAQ